MRNNSFIMMIHFKFFFHLIINLSKNSTNTRQNRWQKRMETTIPRLSSFCTLIRHYFSPFVNNSCEFSKIFQVFFTDLWVNKEKIWRNYLRFIQRNKNGERSVFFDFLTVIFLAFWIWTVRLKLIGRLRFVLVT